MLGRDKRVYEKVYALSFAYETGNEYSGKVSSIEMAQRTALEIERILLLTWVC